MKLEMVHCEISNLSVLVEGRMHKGSSDVFDSNLMQWYPGDPRRFEIIHVWLVNGERRVDIVDLLPESDLKRLQSDCEEAFE